MSAMPPANQTKSLVLKSSHTNKASCPSLVSDSSSQVSGSVEPLNTQDNRQFTIDLGPGGPLDVKDSDRLLIWTKWMDWEPNPLYKTGGRRHRIWELNQRITELEQRYYSGQSNRGHTAGSGKFDSPRPQEGNGDEPVDAGVRKRGTSTRQNRTKAQNTSNPRSHKNRLSGDITSPKGSDKERLLFGHGCFGLLAGKWHFKCYWFKRNPKDHGKCARYHVQEERSVRTGHAKRHMNNNDITEETHRAISHLVCAEFRHLPSREKEAALWRETFVILFPDHRVVRDLLNPFIGDLFSDRGRAEVLLAAAGSSLVRSLPALLESPIQDNEQDSRAATQTPGPTMNVATFAADANVVAQEGPSPTHGGDGIALNAHHRPLAMPSDSFQPVMLSTSGLPQLANPMPAILALLGPVEGVGHDPRTITLTFQLTLPIDLQLGLAPSDAPAPIYGRHEVLPIFPELQPQYWPPNDQFQAQVGAIREDDRQIIQRDALERAWQAAVSARTIRQQVVPSSQSAPSLITDDTIMSGPWGTSSTLEPRTPPEDTDVSSSQSRQMILPETSQQDKAQVESQNESIASPGHNFDDLINYDGC